MSPPPLRYSCVALAGGVTEYLQFGRAEGGVSDILQLDKMFGALQVERGGRGGGGGHSGRVRGRGLCKGMGGALRGVFRV